MIQKNAVTVGGCDESCVNKCTNMRYYTMQTVGRCLNKCYC